MNTHSLSKLSNDYDLTEMGIEQNIIHIFYVVMTFTKQTTVHVLYSTYMYKASKVLVNSINNTCTKVSNTFTIVSEYT